MAARQLGLRPVWALGSSGGVKAFPILRGVECLTLLMEADDASAQSLRGLRREMARGGPRSLHQLADQRQGPKRRDQAPGCVMNDEGAPFITKKYTPPSRFVLIRFADFTPLEGDDYCVKGFLPRTGLAVFWGPPKSGKSFFVFDLLMHVAFGWDYRGRHVRQGPVVYVCLEGGRGFRKRREAFRLAKLKKGDDPPFFFVTNPLSLAADRQKLIDDIRRQAGTDIPAVVCVDTLNRSLAGSENSDEDMAAYIKAADAVRDAFNCLVVVVHHSGHEAQRPRGHSSLMGALDVQIAVRRDAEENVVAELELAKDGETGTRIPLAIGKDRDRPRRRRRPRYVVRRQRGYRFRIRRQEPAKGRRSDDVEKVKRSIIETYERLADEVDTSLGFNGKPVKKDRN